MNPLIALHPFAPPSLAEAVTAAGGTAVALVDGADAVVWLGGSTEELAATLSRHPSIRWVQLPSAGVEGWAAVVAERPDLKWTCAKGLYGPIVAEHAVMLLLAAARRLPRVARRTGWEPEPARTVRGTRAVILGGGGIAQNVARLLGEFGVRCGAVRNHASQPVPHCQVTVGMDRLAQLATGADHLVVAWALTAATRGQVNRSLLDALAEDANLVNVARGECAVTSDIQDWLESRPDAAAALDVTDPEPLPGGHALWRMSNCVITPHSACTPSMAVPLLAERIRRNVAAFAAAQELEGMVSPDLGY